MKKKIQRASLKERLYFLFHGIIPNYAMRANHDVSNAWINILSKNLKGEGYDFWKYTSEEQKKTVLTFFCTNRISSVYEIRKKFEKEFPRHYKGNEGMSSLGFDFGRPDYLPEDEQDKQKIVEGLNMKKHYYNMEKICIVIGFLSIPVASLTNRFGLGQIPQLLGGIMAIGGALVALNYEFKHIMFDDK